MLSSLPGCRDREPVASAPNNAKVEEPRVRLQTAMQAEDWELANQYAQEALIISPSDPDLLTLAAKTAAYCGKKREAAQLLVDAATHSNFSPESRVDFAVQALIDVGELYKAVDLLEASLEQNPENHRQRRTLVGFLSEVQRMELLPTHLQKLYLARQFDFHLLLTVTETSSHRLSPKTAQTLLERNPADHRVRLSEAFVLMYRHDAKAAAKVLEDILEHHPGFAPAHAMYGQALMAENRLGEIEDWIANSDTESLQFANYWLTLGDLALRNDEIAEACRAYWEATRRNPNSNAAWDRLSQAMAALRNDPATSESVSPDQIETVLQRSIDMIDLRERFNHFAADGKTSQSKAANVATALFNLGRVWEAEAWSAAATQLPDDPSEDLQGLRTSILAKLRQDQNWLAKDASAFSVDLSSLPKPEINSKSLAKSSRSSVVPTIEGTSHLRLEEVSDAWGITGIGANNNPTDARLAAIIRSTGVGGGVIDYDLDGLPDTVVMGAGGTMQKRDSQNNDLLRNVGGRFERVTTWAGIADRGFGQGLAIGDFNEDGFADLFFANLGENRLFRNNGDGTFTDCSVLLADNDPETWSTSAVFADIDQDGIADLLVTNYCQTIDGLDEGCLDEEGTIGPCHPLTFPAEADQFFVGKGDGMLKDVTNAWAPNPSTGRGLGIVAGRLDGKRLALFIANDMSRNAYYSKPATNSTSLTEDAAVRGVAVDGRTQAQASMGIASSDFDHDGDLDLYVTGFGREYNIFYEQVAPGIWRDETSKLDLVQPTLSMIGFGTEAIDLDNDGVEEIVVTNGHIGDFPDPDSLPYEQPFQIFRRQGDGRFSQLQDDGWGGYFKTPHVGRGLWTLDANRDGKNDLMITHTKEQVRLLINESESAGHHIGFRLVGTTASRDAVGSTLRFTYDGAPRTLWLLGGDGYLCSNERVLRAGIDQATAVEDVEVTWPDGTVEAFGMLAADQEYAIIEGQGQAFPLTDKN
ncbi:MAG: FG-GAP-like repeat-containing protein [Rubripirellula sp.]